MSCDDVFCDEPFEACLEQDGTGRYTAILTDEDDTVIPLASVSTLTLKLTNQSDGEVINSRDDQNVLNTNNGSFDVSSGLLTFVFQPDDSPITAAGSYKRREIHVAMFTLTLTNGTTKRWPVLLTVDNLDKLAGGAA